MTENRSGPAYKPGDVWVICDLSGIKVRMSETRKTWDGLRVWSRYWYPKHSQLFVKGIPDHMEVIDGRGRQPDVFTYPTYGNGPWTLSSIDSTIWNVTVSDAGSLVSRVGLWQPEPPPLYLAGYEITISNLGVLTASASAYSGPTIWVMYSPNGTKYNITTPGGVITVTAG